MEGVICENCGKEYVQIAQHWRGSCGYPEMSEYQKELLTGLVMGDACVDKPSKTPLVKMNMTNEKFLNWVSEKLGIIATEPRFIRTAEEQAKASESEEYEFSGNPDNYSEVYTLNTRCHEFFHKLMEWMESGEKEWPDDLELTPVMVKMLYVSDGSMRKDSRTEGTRPSLRIESVNESGDGEKIVEMFENIGFDGKWNRSTFYFSADESERLWNYMGSPPPGFEYKWPENFKA